MPQAVWPLFHHRPVIEIVLVPPKGNQLTRRLLADTGAGTSQAGFELILPESDCLACGGIPSHSVVLGGAYSGSFPVYVLRVLIPQLAFDHYVRAVGVSTAPSGLDGIAGFRFLNRFTYGSFGNSLQFGLQM